MTGLFTREHRDRCRRRLAWPAILLMVCLLADRAVAQAPPVLLPPTMSTTDEVPIPRAPAKVKEPDALELVIPIAPPRPKVKTQPVRETSEDEIKQASCSSCGGGIGLGPSDWGCGAGSWGRLPCVPGQKPCPDCGCGPNGNNWFDRFLGSMREAICCPDPCYEGHWLPVADAGFFTTAVRPVNQMRIRWDSAFNWLLADRAEYLWARDDGKGKGPGPPPGLKAVNSLHYNDLNIYTEAGTGRITAIVDMRYRSMEPDGIGHTAGFGDIAVGTKTLLFDSELFQLGMQLLTYIPSGNAMKGLGTGHVSLEPTLLAGVRLGPDTYLQSQLSEWIPLGGDKDYAGAILHYHFSLNQVLWRFRPDIPLVGTCELNGWSFQDGAYTDPVLGSFQGASGFTYASMGPGLRLFVCDRLDIGAAASFSLTDPHFADQFYRVEMRFRF